MAHMTLMFMGFLLVFDCGGEDTCLTCTENPNRHREKMQTPHSWKEPRPFCCALTTALAYFSYVEDLSDSHIPCSSHTRKKDWKKKRALCWCLWTGRRQVHQHFKGMGAVSIRGFWPPGQHGCMFLLRLHHIQSVPWWMLMLLSTARV